MKKVVIIGIVFIAVIVAVLAGYKIRQYSKEMIPGYSNKYINSIVQFPENPDNTTYLPWGNGEYSYKSYTGEPSIDSPEFEAVNKARYEAGGCNFMPYSKYHVMPLDEVEALSETDSNAMLELYLRKSPRDNSTESPLIASAKMGNVAAKLIIISFTAGNGVHDKRYTSLLNRYETITPQATLIKWWRDVQIDGDLYSYENTFSKSSKIYVLMHIMRLRSQETVKNGAEKLITATNYSQAQYFTSNHMPGHWEHYKDARCEAYFNGCPVHVLPYPGCRQR